MICPNCKRDRAMFYNNLCRACYDNVNIEKKMKDRKIIYKGYNKNIIEILHLYLGGMSRKEIYAYVSSKRKCTYRNICRTIQKYIEVF